MPTTSPSLDPSIPIPEAGRHWAESHLAGLTLEQKAAQCLVVLPGATADGRPDDETLAAVRGGLGTLHSITGLTASVAARYHADVGAASVESGLPPILIGGNLEAGIGYSLGATGTDLPYPRGIGMADDEGLAYRAAQAGGAEARSLGYRWSFSPCIDVVTTADDPILGVRAYGVDAARTGALGAAQIRGLQDAGVLATAKHFPGHGDSAVDSHLDLPRIDRSVTAHEEIHLAPYRAAIEAGVGSIMVAHVVLPGLGVDEPASLSSRVNRDWLRGDLGYRGLIITDSLRMKAIAARYDAGAAAVLSLRAGADVANVKCPAADFAGVLARVVEAVRSGELDESLLDAAVLRLLETRCRVGADQPHAFDATEAQRFDPPLTWDDELRRATVSVRPGRGGRPTVQAGSRCHVVGESPLAVRMVAMLRERGVDAVHVEAAASRDVLERVGLDEEEAAVIPIFTPSLPMTGSEAAAMAGAVAADGEGVRLAAVVVNTAADAATLPPCGAPVVAVPAVDAFDMVTDAAVRAAVDVLG